MCIICILKKLLRDWENNREGIKKVIKNFIENMVNEVEKVVFEYRMVDVY